jgi:hypothetical protein
LNFHCNSALDFRRHSRRLRKVPHHIGISLLRSGDGPFGVFPMVHADRCLGNCGQRHAHAQVRSDEIEACLFGFGPEPQKFLVGVGHIDILGDHDFGDRLRRGRGCCQW